MSGAIINWLRASSDAVRTSLWVIPGAMFLLGIALAIGLLSLDDGSATAAGALQPWIGAGNGEDARNLLATLLTAVIAMASIVFSVTVLSLSLAANTYGPRLVRTFRADRRTQLVLGLFMMTIVYLLLVMRAVRGDAAAGQVPDTAVALGSALSLVCVIALLAFVQGVSSLIVADDVVRRVRRELDSAIDRLPAEDGKSPPASAELPGDFDQQAARIRLPREGYVQSVDYSGLVEWADKHDAVVRLDFRPGDFVVEGDHKLLLYPALADPEQSRAELAKFIISGAERTPTQDLEFAIRHLVEVAVRALSPGINDPFTAMAVVDRLRGALARLAAKQLPSSNLFAQSGRLRAVRKVTSYSGVADAAFNQIRQAASAKPALLIHLLRALGGIAEHTRNQEQREALARHAELVTAAAERNVKDAVDLADVRQAHREALGALDAAARA